MFYAMFKLYACNHNAHTLIIVETRLRLTIRRKKSSFSSANLSRIEGASSNRFPSQ